MTKEEREQILKISGVLEGMSMMLLPCNNEMVFLANQLMDVSMDLDAIAKGVDDVGMKNGERG